MKYEFNKLSMYGGQATVFGGVLIHLTLGNLYSFGNLMTYLASYLRKEVSPDVVYSDVVWVIAITTSSQGLFMPLAGLLEKRLGPRLTCAVGCLTMSCGVWLTYYSVQYSLLGVILTYGLLVGLGISLAYVTPLACAMKWFPERKGLINGLIVAGFGCGALGSTTLQTHYLNPDNVPVASTGYFEDEGVLSRVPSVFLLMAGVFVVLQLLGCLILSSPTTVSQSNSVSIGSLQTETEIERTELLGDEWEDWEHLQPNSEEASIDTVEEPPAPQVKSYTPRQMSRMPLFWKLWSIYLLNTLAIGYINATYKSFGQTFLHNDKMLSLVGSLAAIFNAGGRLFWGRMMDASSFKASMCCVTVSLCALFAALPLAPHSSFPAVAYAVAVWAIFFTFCGTFVLMPTVAEKAFGSAHYTTNYGLFFTSQVIAGPVVAGLNQLLLDTVGYTGCFLTVSAIAAANFMLTFTLPPRL